MENIVDYLKTQRHRNSTQAQYYSIWKSFNSFFLKLDVKPKKWEDRITLFVGYLVQCNKKSSTVKSYISAIKAVLYGVGIDVTTDQVLMNALTRACRLRNDITMTRLPIKYNLLRSILTTLSDVFEKQPYLHILYKAMFLTMYYGLLRVGEVTYSEHVVKAVDVQIGINKQKLMFILRSSKTHTKGDKPQIIKISADEGNDVISSRRIKSNENIANCPFQAVRAYLAMRRRMCSSKNEPFFIFRDEHQCMHTISGQS